MKVDERSIDSLFQVVDGKSLYFPEIRNWWSTGNSSGDVDWFGLEFAEPKKMSAVVIKPVVIANRYVAPDSASVFYLADKDWTPVKPGKRIPEKLTGNSSNHFEFTPVTTRSVRIFFYHRKSQVAFTEIEIY